MVAVFCVLASTSDCSIYHYPLFGLTLRDLWVVGASRLGVGCVGVVGGLGGGASCVGSCGGWFGGGVGWRVGVCFGGWRWVGAGVGFCYGGGRVCGGVEGWGGYVMFREWVLEVGWWGGGVLERVGGCGGWCCGLGISKGERVVIVSELLCDGGVGEGEGVICFGAGLRVDMVLWVGGLSVLGSWSGVIRFGVGGAVGGMGGQPICVDGGGGVEGGFVEDCEVLGNGGLV
ncbi:hypothetical protein Tco_1548339 [Tanacetum coccineum]